MDQGEKDVAPSCPSRGCCGVRRPVAIIIVALFLLLILLLLLGAPKNGSKPKPDPAPVDSAIKRSYEQPRDHSEESGGFNSYLDALRNEKVSEEVGRERAPTDGEVAPSAP